MTIKSDKWIRRRAELGMIEPFVGEKCRHIDIPDLCAPTVDDPRPRVKRVPAISFGCSSYGYDLRVADKFKVFTPVYNTIVDPKNLEPEAFVTIEGKGHCIIPPNSFALAYSVERFDIPKNVLAVVVGKSTYARVGIICNVTPLEPGWRGHVTLEISNTTPLPAKVYANEGLCQVLFYESDEYCDQPYAGGKYQDQAADITLPR